MSVFGELQRRKVIRVAGVYVVASWLLLQIAATVAPILALPEWFEELVLVLLAIGFPVALILAWALEQSPDGLVRDSGAPSSGRTRIIDYAILVFIGIGALYLTLENKVSDSPASDVALDPSVAVLPFTNLNADTENEAFTAGIHSDLLAQLAKIRSLRTISRTSMLPYRDSGKSVPEIADELGVATVLEAGVQRAGQSVRINVQLIDAAADEAMWTEVYDRELTAANIFAIQSEIARAISVQLQASLSSDDIRRLNRVPTNSIDALDAYFVGKQLLERRNEQSLIAAAEYFETVVDIDPNFALGWSGLADAYMLLPEHSSGFDREFGERRAREGVRRALELNPDLPEVRASEAWYQLRFFDWDGAERIFRDALAVAPDNTNVLHWLSHVLSFRGQHEEAIEISRYAVGLEPDSNMLRTNLAYILIDARQFDEGLPLVMDITRDAPGHMAARHNVFLHELRAGRPAKGRDAFIDFTTQIGGDPDAARQIGAMFVAYAELGEVGDVPQELVDRTRLGNEDLAQVLAFVGDREGTIAALQIAASEHSGSRSVFSMKINPGYDFIRDDPRFIALLGEVGLAD